MLVVLLLTWHMAITRLCPMVHEPKNIRGSINTGHSHNLVPSKNGQHLHSCIRPNIGFILVGGIFFVGVIKIFSPNWIANDISLYFVFLGSFLIYFNFCFTVLFSWPPPPPPPATAKSSVEVTICTSSNILVWFGRDASEKGVAGLTESLISSLFAIANGLEKYKRLNSQT